MGKNAFKTSLEEWKHIGTSKRYTAYLAFKTSLEEWKPSRIYTYAWSMGAF